MIHESSYYDIVRRTEMKEEKPCCIIPFGVEAVVDAGAQIIRFDFSNAFR